MNRPSTILDWPLLGQAQAQCTAPLGIVNWSAVWTRAALVGRRRRGTETAHREMRVIDCSRGLDAAAASHLVAAAAPASRASARWPRGALAMIGRCPGCGP